VVAVLLVKRRISKSTEGRLFLDKLHLSMNTYRYSNKLVDQSNFVSLGEINSILSLPSKVDLDFKFVSIEETMVESVKGLSNAEKAIKVYIYDSHDYYNPVPGSPFASQKAAARGLLESLISSSETGIRSALDTSRLYLGRFKITSTPWSPSPESSTNLSQDGIRSRQLISNKPGNIGTLTIVVDLVNNKEIGIFLSFKAAYADIKEWRRSIDISSTKLADLTKKNMTYNNFKFYLSSHLPETFYKGKTDWWNS